METTDETPTFESERVWKGALKNMAVPPGGHQAPRGTPHVQRPAHTPAPPQGPAAAMPPPPSPPTPPAGGSGGSGGLNAWMQSHKLVGAFLYVLVLIMFSVVLNLIHDYFAETNIDRFSRWIKIQAQNKNLSASPSPSMANTSPAVPTPIQSREQFLAGRKQAMIDRCGRNTQVLAYKVDPGCFYFDNVSGTATKTISLWSRADVFSIEGEFDEKPNIIITAPDGGTCESSSADRCRKWVLERNQPQPDGFKKFSVHVPQGQGFIANIIQR